MDWLYTGGALFRELNANRLRRLLSILGVIIGTGAVISTLAVVEGGRSQLEGTLEKLGVNVVFLEDRYEPAELRTEVPSPGEGPPPRNAPFAAPGADGLAQKKQMKNAIKETVMLGGSRLGRTIPRARTLTAQDIDFLRIRFPGAARIEPQMLHRAKLGGAGEKPFSASVEGGTPAGAGIRNLRLSEGRYLYDADVENAARVCVLGSAMAAKLFGPGSAVNSSISALGTRWRVVGVLEPKGSMLRFDYDELIAVPLTALQERTGRSMINGVLIGAKGTEEALQIHAGLLDEVLPRLYDRKREEFRTFCQDKLMEQHTKTLRTFKTLMVSIAAFSLLVSGIGIMNIMLVSVRERTRDIGIWKSVGATDGDVLCYFLGESVLTCLVGGALGIMLGMFLGVQATGLIARSIDETAGWVPIFRTRFLLLSFGTAALVGLLSGLFPAYIAARQEPIEALRYE